MLAGTSSPRPMGRLPTPQTFSSFSSDEISRSKSKVGVSDVFYPDKIFKENLFKSADQPVDESKPLSSKEEQGNVLFESQFKEKDLDEVASKAGSVATGVSKSSSRVSSRLFKSTQEMVDLTIQTEQQIDANSLEYHKTLEDLRATRDRLTQQDIQLALLTSKLDIASSVIQRLMAEKAHLVDSSSSVLSSSSSSSSSSSAILNHPILSCFTNNDYDGYVEERFSKLIDSLRELN